LILFCSLLRGQDLKCSKKWYIKPAVNYGFIWEHRASIGHLITGYVPMLELNFVKPSDGCKLWQCENNKPDYGVHFTFMDFGNPKVLGQAYALAPYIEIPLGEKVRWSRPIFRLSWGLSYVTKKFDRETNHKNVAIGSHWNIFVQYRFMWHFNINEKLRLEPGIGISHCSNGRLQVPNLGLNLIGLNLGLTYKFRDQACERITIDSCTKAPSKTELLFWYSIGLNDQDPPATMSKMVAHTLSLNYFYNIRNTSKLGLGADVFYEESYLRELDNEHITYPGFADQLRVGIKGNYAYNIGRVSLPFEVGYYVHSKFNSDGPIFSRFGIRYTSGKGFMAQFSMKSHFAVAYHFDICVGYRLSLKKKKV
jgi:hypothetical protein